MEWRKTQEGLGAEIGRQCHRTAMDGEKSYRRPRSTMDCSAKEKEEFPHKMMNKITE
jgi:hypothetical protein